MEAHGHSSAVCPGCQSVFALAPEPVFAFSERPSCPRHAGDPPVASGSLALPLAHPFPPDRLHSPPRPLGLEDTSPPSVLGELALASRGVHKKLSLDFLHLEIRRPSFSHCVRQLSFWVVGHISTVVQLLL